MKYDFLLVGVGGQGTILASDIVAEVGLLAGFDAKKSEIHGMSQRGGCVESHVRWADHVYSPLAEKGNVDFLIAFELLEAARWASYLRPGGFAVVNRHRIAPLSVMRGEARYPTEEQILSQVEVNQSRAFVVEGSEIASGLGNVAAAGIVLLGVLSSLLDVAPDLWLSVIERRVPARFVELNHKAFLRGRENSLVLAGG